MKLIYNNLAWTESLILKKQILNRNVFFLIMCHVLIWIIRRQDAIFIENKEDKTIQKMLKVCAGQKNVTGARASQ